jgi:hypothetical protein
MGISERLSNCPHIWHVTSDCNPALPAELKFRSSVALQTQKLYEERKYTYIHYKFNPPHPVPYATAPWQVLENRSVTSKPFCGFLFVLKLHPPLPAFLYSSAACFKPVRMLV